MPRQIQPRAGAGPAAEAHAPLWPVGGLAAVIEQTCGIYPTDVELASLSSVCVRRLDKTPVARGTQVGSLDEVPRSREIRQRCRI